MTERATASPRRPATCQDRPGPDCTCRQCALPENTRSARVPTARAKPHHIEHGPTVAATLELLREHGPAGPAFWRLGREDRQNLFDAIGNPSGDAALARRAEEARRRQAQEAAEHEAQRPVCGDCGQKFTDDRWKASIAVDWCRGDSHPHLCDDCKAWALEVERQAEQAARERQEAEAVQASKAGGWLGRWRS